MKVHPGLGPHHEVHRPRLSGVRGHGLGIGEIKYDYGEERNGCDRCGCPDEQKCCPGFWNDRGVPPIWPLSWIFNPRNKYLNDNRKARIFGNFGFKFFDKERKAFMGVALSVTICAMLFTAVSISTISPNVHFLHITAWGVASFRYDSDDGGKIGRVNYIGLQKFAVVTCKEADAEYYFDWSKCSVKGVWWSSVKCSDGEEDFYGFPCGPIDTCGNTSLNLQFGAVMTCVTLIFAMIGCLTRMRKVADTNFQKMIGCFPDTLGIITQAQALSIFAADCYENMPVRSTTGDRIHYRVGVGYWAFVVCWLAAIIRATVHYCTPVPGGGVGCRFEDMKLVVDDVLNTIEQRIVTTSSGSNIHITQPSNPQPPPYSVPPPPHSSLPPRGSPQQHDIYNAHKHHSSHLHHSGGHLSSSIRRTATLSKDDSIKEFVNEDGYDELNDDDDMMFHDSEMSKSPRMTRKYTAENDVARVNTTNL
mmetsp:Transcript_35136/g.45315  ORF Transcript_35136/g.45315 Transcript_35136/m.45315 type:complete len:475 (+) Transcript_35136:59-1483(+)